MSPVAFPWSEAGNGVPMFDSESCPISDNSQVSTWNSASLLSGWIPPCFQVPEYPPSCGSVWACPHGDQRGQLSETGFFSYCTGFGKASQQAWQQALLQAEPSHRLYFFSSVPGSSPLTGSQIPTPKCAWSLKTTGKKPWPLSSTCLLVHLVVASLVSAQCPAALAE